MYTALEHNRLYRIGFGSKAKLLIYMYRDFPVADEPAVFNFQTRGGGELVTFSLPQLTILEQQGAIEYLGTSL